MTALSRVLARRMHLIAPRTTDVRHDRDLTAVMDDGAVLLADRWVAADVDGRPQPTVLVRSPYGRRQFTGLVFGRMLAERGFQVVVQSVRGTFGSDGVFTPFDERADGAATLRWLRAQPWHEGRVATFGPSYLGLVQWALAAERPDDLAAMAIQVSASQFYDQTYAGGSVALETIASWMAILAVQERRLGTLRINRALRALTPLLAEQPLIGVDELATGAPVAWLREGFEHPGRDDDYWARRDFSETVGRVTSPVSFVGGWHDILVPWMLDDVRALQDAGQTPRVLIGPWTHTSPQLMAVGHREAIAFLRDALYDDDRLLRAHSGALPVQLRLSGEGAVRREFAAWPPAEAESVRWYARAQQELSREAPPSAQPGVERYRYDPADPTPSFGGPVLMSREPVVDNGPLEARADVLTFTSAPLTDTVEAIGRPVAEIWARADGPSFDIFVRICDVDDDGISRNVCDALASVRPGGDPSHAPGPDGIVALRFELWPLGHRFAAGHRIRLQISSGAYPRYARNPGTGEDPAAVALSQMRAVDVEVLRDGAHPSGITLPVIAPGPRPTGGASGAGA